MHAYVCLYVSVYMHALTKAHRGCVCLWAYVCLCVHICTCMCAYVHICAFREQLWVTFHRDLSVISLALSFIT